MLSQIQTLHRNKVAQFRPCTSIHTVKSTKRQHLQIYTRYQYEREPDNHTSMYIICIYIYMRVCVQLFPTGKLDLKPH